METFVNTQNRPQLGWARKGGAAFVLPLALMLGACTTAVGSDRYDAYDVNQVQRVYRGVVESWRPVTIQTENGGGTAIGAGVGAATGAAIGGRGSSGVIGAVLGGILGGAIGNDIDKNNGKREGFEYIIVLENGERISLVDVTPDPIPAGAPVIIQEGDRTRIRLDRSRIVDD